MMKQVTVYHQPNCAPCHSVMDFLKQRGVPFVAKNVFTDEQAQRELIALGSQSTPTVRIGDDVLVGFSPAKLTKLLQE